MTFERRQLNLLIATKILIIFSAFIISNYLACCIFFTTGHYVSDAPAAVILCLFEFKWSAVGDFKLISAAAGDR